LKRRWRRILSPIILEFVRRYPDLQVDLVTEDRPIDIVAEGFDAGVRPGWPGYHA
jgi:DNA-binding transcriptional LysR family regulator